MWRRPLKLVSCTWWSPAGHTPPSSLQSRQFSSKFVTPGQYAASNLAQYNINVAAVREFLQVYPGRREERLLDFGCGTGETTAAIAVGELGLEVREVVGVDISHEMISHCNIHHQGPRLTFQQLDCGEADSFVRCHDSSFSMITSFHCLHWVQDIPQVLSIFHRVLSRQGRLLLVMAGNQTENNPHRRIFQEMRNEEEWRELLRGTR